MNFESNYNDFFLSCVIVTAPTTRGKVHAVNSQAKENKNVQKMYIIIHHFDRSIAVRVNTLRSI